MAGTLVLGFDGSECASAALESAIDLARRYDDDLVIVFGIEPPVRSVGEEFTEHEKALHEIGERVTGSALKRAHEEGVKADVALVPLRPAPAILQIAQQRDAHMIVIGTHGESPLRGAILGSTPHKLLHLSDRPVLVVPIGGGAPNGG
jgi:nucleotide-binding universal stress UspA family protein